MTQNVELTVFIQDTDELAAADIDRLCEPSDAGNTLAGFHVQQGIAHTLSERKL